MGCPDLLTMAVSAWVLNQQQRKSQGLKRVAQCRSERLGQVSREHCVCCVCLDGKRRDKNWRAYELCEVPQCFAFTSSGGMSTFKYL